MKELLSAALLWLAECVGGQGPVTQGEYNEAQEARLVDPQLDAWTAREDERNAEVNRKAEQRERESARDYVRRLHQPGDRRVVSDEVEADYIYKQRRRIMGRDP